MLDQLENIPGNTSSSVLPYIVHFVLYNIGFKSIYMPLSGLKAKNQNDPKEEDDLRWKMTFDGRRPLTEDDL